MFRLLIKNIIKNLINILKVIKQNNPFLIYSVLADLLFIFLYGMLTSGFYQEILFNLVKISEEAGKYSIIKGTSVYALISSLNSQPEINIYIRGILLNILWIMITVYLLYSLLQGFCWFIANKSINNSLDFLTYMKRFFLINILWFVLYSLYHLLSIVIGFVQSQTYSQGGRIGIVSLPQIFLIVFLISLLYFTFLSYPLIAKYKSAIAMRKTFIMGIGKVYYILPIYFIIGIILIITSYILDLAFRVNPSVMFISGIVLALPLIYLSRLYFISALLKQQNSTYVS